MPSATAGHGIGVNIGATLKAAGIIGLWTYDVTRALVFADHAMAITYGVDPDQAALGVPAEAFLRCYHPEDRLGASHAFRMAVANGTDYNASYRLFHADGSISFIEARGRALVSHGETISMSGANFDVSSASASRSLDSLSEKTRIALEFLARSGWAAQSDGFEMISGQQIRNARSLLDWSITRLAQASGVPTGALVRIERNSGVTVDAGNILRQIKANLEMAGIEFTPTDAVLLRR